MTEFRLGRTAQANGFRVHGFERVGSTNIEAMTAARAGQSDKLWAAALQQTEGRGRRGRSWSSDFGNLAASVYLALPSSVAEPALLGFVAGVSLAQTLDGLVADMRSRSGAALPDIRLKWPNDVIADGAKLVGILLEAERLGNGRLAVVVGMGVNVVAVPEGLPYEAASLDGLGLDVSAQDVFRRLSDAFARNYATWDFGRGSPNIMRSWRAHAAGMGAPISVMRDGVELAGRFETVDDSGRLIVETPEGRRETVTAGDIYFGTAGTARPAVQTT